MSKQITILPPQKENVSEKSKQNLISAKIKLVRAFPFLSFLVMATEYQFTDGVPTCGATTVPRNIIFINDKFHDNGLKNDEERAFVLLHEILHIFLEHIGRQTEMHYNPQLFNVAADFCINSMIKELNSKKIQIPTMVLYNKKYKSMSSDQIYHLILEEAGGDANKAMKQYGGDNIGDHQGKGGQCPLDDLGQEAMSEKTKAENHQKLSASLDNTNESDLKNMGQGQGAADMFRLFKDMIESRIPWQKVLREFITSSSNNRPTYNRCSRRSTKHIIFPSMTGDHVNLVFGVDTSGSMSSKDLADAMSELRGITDEFESWIVTFLSCDTCAHEIGRYVSEDGDEFATIDKSMIGGGGTDMNPMIEYANDLEEEPSVVVILTDGYIPDVNTVQNIPVIMVVTRDGNKDLKSDDAQVLFMDD